MGETTGISIQTGGHIPKCLQHGVDCLPFLCYRPQNESCVTLLLLTWNFWASLEPTREGLVGAASDGEEVLDDVLTVGGLPAPALAQQNDGLILSSGEEVPVGSLGRAIDVRGSVLPPAALKHLHHLKKVETRKEGGGGHVPENINNAFVFIRNISLFH